MHLRDGTSPDRTKAHENVGELGCALLVQDNVDDLLEDAIVNVRHDQTLVALHELH